MEARIEGHVDFSMFSPLARAKSPIESAQVEFSPSFKNILFVF